MVLPRTDSVMTRSVTGSRADAFGHHSRRAFIIIIIINAPIWYDVRRIFEDKVRIRIVQ